MTNTAELDFRFTTEPQVHAARRRAILEAHPEVRELFGPHPSTPIAITAIVAGQLAIAWFVRDADILVVLLLAYVLGAVFSHALYTLMHECAHNLAARGSAANKAFGILCDLPLAIPSAIVFRTYHLVHHRYLGELVMDPDVVTPFEARVVGNSRWRKAIWMALFAISQALRPLKVPGIRISHAWVATNFLIVGGIDVAVYVLMGPASLVFLVCSTLFALGLHPLGGRWLQEHYMTAPDQETYSYYGPGNLVSFNIGYHNEHHDFASVPWLRLPRVRRIAREYDDGLAAYRSWTAVLLRFIFDPKMEPSSRLIHPESRRLEGASRTAANATNGATSTSTV